MSFLEKRKCNYKHEKMTKTSLQANSATSTHLIFKKDVRNHLVVNIVEKGSMTVEAALILSVLMVIVGYLFAFMDGIYIYSKIEAALHQTTREMAHYSYDLSEVIGIDMENYAEAGFGISLIYAKNSIEDYLGEEFLQKYLNHGSQKGLNIWKYSKISEDNIDLAVSYSIPLFWGNQTRVVQRCRMKKWNGYFSEENNSQQEDRVFITEYGEVYHNSRNCTHLRLSIKKVGFSELKGLQNQDGETYCACEYCGDQKEVGSVYITQEGTRFHTNLGCTGLKRTVFNVPISEVGSRMRCSRCGITP